MTTSQYVSDLQETFLETGITEGIRRGRLLQMKDIAKNMRALGYDSQTIIKVLSISLENLNYIEKTPEEELCGPFSQDCKIK
ncbi:MAG: hypothetical protein HUK24_03830 [Sphaerochaetaceae bacterium]|nr:hypothetical protein [Sphaerochaetaceae bacterium]